MSEHKADCASEQIFAFSSSTVRAGEAMITVTIATHSYRNFNFENGNGSHGCLFVTCKMDECRSLFNKIIESIT